MAKEFGFVQRGLILLGLMLVTAAMVLLIILRRGTPPTSETTVSRPTAAALAVANPTGSLQNSINWGALAVLSQDLPASPGKEVRYNAAVSLARHGSSKIPLNVFAQMLDEDLQMRNYRFRAEGKEVVDSYAGLQTVLVALKEFAMWHKNKKAVDAVGRNNPEMQRVYAAIEKLTTSSNPTVKEQAEAVAKKIKTGEW